MSSRGPRGEEREPPRPQRLSEEDSPATEDDTIEIVEVVGVDGESGAPRPPEPPEGPGRTPAGEGGSASGALPSALHQALQLKDKYYDMLLRKQAEFDNFRKRCDRDRKEAGRQAAADLIRSILPVLDSLERALATSEGEEGPLRQGVVLIYQQLMEVLRKEGLLPVETVGARFDPRLHEAVEVVDVEGSEQDTILEEMQRGYTFNDRLLRPALVKVASGRAPGSSGGGPAPAA
ncbi:MAG: nucleotide exchange factor GrpE [Acidobacteriota bacterium]